MKLSNLQLHRLLSIVSVGDRGWWIPTTKDKAPVSWRRTMRAFERRGLVTVVFRPDDAYYLFATPAAIELVNKVTKNRTKLPSWNRV